MKIYHSIKDVKKIPSGSVLTVGIFDGIHTGHIHIIKRLIKRARESHKKSLILTFYPHPSLLLHPKRPTPLLISLEHRLRLLQALGIDIVVLVKFTRNFSKMKPEDFIAKVLQKRLCMKEILVGDDFIFGYQGSGDIRLLKKLSGKYHFKVRRVNLLKTKNRIISSTYIRTLIIDGRLKEASKLLGRPISILGTVKRGTERGRILGYPTANIDPHHEAIPPSGVYAVYIRLNNKRYRGILNIGFRPTFHPIRYPLFAKRYPLEPTIEAHIFNFNKDIYGKDLEIIFVKRLRPEKRFKDRESLRRRIMLDEKAARKVFSKRD